MSTSNPWIVDTKGGPDSTAWEICVLRENNQPGRDSLGWFGENKLYVSSSGGPCCEKVDQYTWDLLVEVAQRVASRLNRIEKPHS